MLDNLPLNKIGFADDTKEDVKNIYHSFYSTVEEIKYGIVAIKVEV